jgi:hypothetical protein
MREIILIHNKRDWRSKREYDRYYYHNIYKFKRNKNYDNKIKYKKEYKKYLVEFK